MTKLKLFNPILFASLILVVISTQFIFGAKHLQYGFNIDDWNVLAWYKQVVSNPILDMAGAWQAIGPHNFSHAYYIGVLFEFFKFNYLSYHLLNTLFKVLAALSLYPLVYFLFKSQPLAFFATVIFAIHPGPFGALNNVIVGEDFLMVISINLLLTIYIHAFLKKNFSKKIIFSLMVLLFAAAYFDITRSYPVIVALPLVELLNFGFNKSARNVKAIFLRLLFVYSPFIILQLYYLFSPRVEVTEANLNKLINLFKTGNYQLFLTLFASFGSTFAPQGLIDWLKLFTNTGDSPIYRDFWTFFGFFLRFLVIGYAVSLIMRLLTNLKSRFIFRTLLLTTFLSMIAFIFSNHWISLDPQIQRGGEPGLYLTPALLGILIFSTGISFFWEWLGKERNSLLLGLSLSVLFSFLYTFMTWLLVDANSVFMGVHAYLTVATIGSSIFLAIFLFLSYQKLFLIKTHPFDKLIACLTLIFFLLFLISSYRQVDGYYADQLINGYSAALQDKIHSSFFREVGRDKISGGSNILIYIDGSADYENGSFYASSFVWVIPAMLTMEKDEPFDIRKYCRSVVATKDFDKIRIGIVNGEKVIIQNTCGYDLAYKIDNFYAFRMINRDLIPIKSEILNELESK